MDFLTVIILSTSAWNVDLAMCLRADGCSLFFSALFCGGCYSRLPVQSVNVLRVPAFGI